jgi:hypothetical protein
MKISLFQRFFFGWAIITLVLVTQGCGASPDQDHQAQLIYDRAEKLWSQGKIVPALKEFYQLVEYRHTEAFQKAEATLLEEGISITDPLNSWTLKKMIAAQNTLNKKGKDRHPDGNITVPYPMMDAWGRSIVIKYSTGDKYTFAVCSAGKDRKFGNDDDLLIFNRPHFGTQKGKTTASSARASKPSRKTEDVVRIQDLMTNN